MKMVLLQSESTDLLVIKEQMNLNGINVQVTLFLILGVVFVGPYVSREVIRSRCNLYMMLSVAELLADVAGDGGEHRRSEVGVRHRFVHDVDHRDVNVVVT